MFSLFDKGSHMSSPARPLVVLNWSAKLVPVAVNVCRTRLISIHKRGEELTITECPSLRSIKNRCLRSSAVLSFKFVYLTCSTRWPLDTRGKRSAYWQTYIALLGDFFKELVCIELVLLVGDNTRHGWVCSVQRHFPNYSSCKNYCMAAIIAWWLQGWSRQKAWLCLADHGHLAQSQASLDYNYPLYVLYRVLSLTQYR